MEMSMRSNKHKKGQWSVQFVMDPGLAEQDIAHNQRRTMFTNGKAVHGRTGKRTRACTQVAPQAVIVMASRTHHPGNERINRDLCRRTKATARARTNRAKSQGKSQHKGNTKDMASPFRKDEQGFAPWPAPDSSKFVLSARSRSGSNFCARHIPIQLRCQRIPNC